jgi:hypothetical protein
LEGATGRSAFTSSAPLILFSLTILGAASATLEIENETIELWAIEGKAITID